MSLIGLDLGVDFSRYCVMDESGRILEEGSVRSTEQALRQEFGGMPPSLIAAEFDIASLWALELLTDLGHTLMFSSALPPELKTSLSPLVERMAWHCQNINTKLEPSAALSRQRHSIVFREGVSQGHESGTLFLISLEKTGGMPHMSDACCFTGPVTRTQTAPGLARLVEQSLLADQDTRTPARVQAARLLRLYQLGEVAVPEPVGYPAGMVAA